MQRTQIGYYSGSVETHDSPLDPEHAATPLAWTLGRDASNHFESGSIGGNAAGAFAYSASLTYIQQLGVANIQSHRQPLVAALEQEVPQARLPAAHSAWQHIADHHLRHEGRHADREKACGRKGRRARQQVLVPLLALGL